LPQNIVRVSPVELQTKRECLGTVMPSQRNIDRRNDARRQRMDTMNTAKIILTLFAAVAATSLVTPTPSFAQSQPNYGPNSPGGGDTFGEPYSGTAAARRKSGGW
jgi:hypothetical protein